MIGRPPFILAGDTVRDVLFGVDAQDVAAPRECHAGAHDTAMIAFLA
jgi:hypothetical protein